MKSWFCESECSKRLERFGESAMDEPLHKTLLDAIRFLEQHQIPYAMIGGLAASLRGEARSTADVDLVIGINVDEALTLIGNLANSPFQPLFAGVEEVVSQAFILPLRHRLTGIKVDLSLGMSGFERQLIARAESVEIGARSFQLATAEDLLVMKLLAGRPRDQQDARGIAVVQGQQLDWQYCSDTARQLGDAVGQDIVSHVEKLMTEHGK